MAHLMLGPPSPWISLAIDVGPLAFLVWRGGASRLYALTFAASCLLHLWQAVSGADAWVCWFIWLALDVIQLLALAGWAVKGRG
jgi:hypothetical protein